MIHHFVADRCGGAEIYTYNLARALSKDHDVCVFYRTEDPGAPPYSTQSASYSDLPIVRINSGFHNRPNHLMRYRDRRIDRAFARFLRDSRCDVVHFQHLHGLSIGMVSAAKQLGIPTVLTLQEFWFMCPRGQLVDFEWERCRGPDVPLCARCIGQPLGFIGMSGRQTGDTVIDLIGTPSDPVVAQASIEAPRTDFVAANVMTIDGQPKHTLFAHPTSEVRYRVRLPAESDLQFSVAMHENTKER